VHAGLADVGDVPRAPFAAASFESTLPLVSRAGRGEVIRTGAVRA